MKHGYFLAASMVLSGSLALSTFARAQSSAGLEAPLPQVTVVGTTPVPGMRIDVDKVPGNVQSLSAEQLRQDGVPSVIDGLAKHLGSVNINDTLADPFQPDLLYRGFEASPVLGTPQGLAVYQNGVRINEAFGDTVNWDLFPDIAIDRVVVVTANPLFGLNALGGAVSITMKNGFSYHGADGELVGGSFNQRQGAAEFGGNNGVLGAYGAARVLTQDGWRRFSHDSIRQYFLAVSYRNDAASVDVSFTRAANRLFGQGAAPLQSLDLDPRNVFTSPQNNVDTLQFVALNGAFNFADTTGVQTVLYVRNFRQTVANGDDSDYAACTTDAAAGALCQGDGATPLTDATGAFLPDISNGGATLIGQNDSERIRSDGLGGSLQFTAMQPLAGHGNSFAAGATVDVGETQFNSRTEVGVIDASLTVLPSGLFIATPEGTAFSATPVLLAAIDKHYGLYATDTLDVTAALTLTLSARYNIAKIDLSDREGSALDGNNRFTHLNPAIGATYKVMPSVTTYASYSINNRAPTASEIECSNPAQPCLLPSSLAGDPPNLRQVVAHTGEVGVRGRWSGGAGAQLSWSASAFRTDSENDIYGVASSISTGSFQNIGATRRQGLEAGLNYEDSHYSLYAQYSYIEATFRSALLLNSPANASQDADGNIQVNGGDRLPLIPLHRIKLGGDYSPLPHWSIGGSLVLATSSFYRGDESNLSPQLPGYHVFSLRTSYRINHDIELFANVQNLFDERYSTVGLLADPTGVGAPGVPAGAGLGAPGVDNRFQSPGMPRSYFGGVRWSF